MTRRDLLILAAAAQPLLGKAGHLELHQVTSSTASLSGFSFEDSLNKLLSLGFEGVEILTFAGQKHSIGPIPGVEVPALQEDEKKRLRKLVSRFRHVTTHIPFHGLNPVARDAALRDHSRELIRRGIADSGFWGASVGTLHIASEPDYDPVRKDIIDTFRQFGDLAAKHKLRLGIETGAPNTVAGYLAMIREIDHPHVCATVDTGHTRGYRKDAGVTNEELATEKGRQRYNDVLMQKVEGLGAKLIHFHLDDVRPADWREHRTPGTGLVDWKRLFTYLAKSNFTGAMALELEETPVVDSLRQSRDFLASVIRSL